ncbi:hypothetical protein CANTEDRAFT_134795 [Yamadazyma tenuis ATCC 10573]|nr:uncharacterized protein CANTEDRAFT_134795 [Yamadazyma tenuis ATCC 10573]EGV64209.1 hypothetical protein CANTEDRAFT_134795 [Yamadazyma tenuis ATCC 10573]
MILGDENGSFDQEHKEGEDIVVESGATDNPENYLNPVSIPNLLDMNNFLDGYLSQQSWMSGVLRDMGISK